MAALARLSAMMAIVIAAASLSTGSLVFAQGTPAASRFGDPSQGYTGQFPAVLDQLNAYWLENFVGTGAPYRRPAVNRLEGPIRTACGPAGADDFAFYCPVDEGIYYSPQAFAVHVLRFGDFAPIVVIAHEWGHHVQHLLAIPAQPGTAFELQADCLSGAFAHDAGEQGLLDPGDVTEALLTAADAADDPDDLALPQDSRDSRVMHGINDDRVSSFMRGYLDGVGRCGLPLAMAPQEPVSPPADRPLLIGTLLPTLLDLPQGQTFRLEDDGASSFADLVRFLPDPERTPDLLTEWGWEENVYRVYSSDDPPPNAVGWLSLGIHRFATVDGAAAALPYFAAARRDDLGFQPVDVGLFADQTEAFAGPAVNGQELIVYARRGNLIVRADGVAPDGDPTTDVFEALLIPLRQLVDEPRVVSPALFDLLPREADLDPGLQLAEEHARSAASIAATFPDVSEAERLFQQWGWRENAARVFTAAPTAGATRVEVSVFRLADARAAAEALPYFLAARATALGLSSLSAPTVAADDARAVSGPVAGGEEVTVYLRRGPDLFRITAIGDDPLGALAGLFARW